VGGSTTTLRRAVDGLSTALGTATCDPLNGFPELLPDLTGSAWLPMRSKLMARGACHDFERDCLEPVWVVVRGRWLARLARYQGCACS